MTDTLAVVATNVNKHPLAVLRERLEVRKDELRAALPSDIHPDRFIRAITTAAQINPDLLATTFQSLWLACMRACRDGLLPDGVEGAIVPYKDKAQWIPMYRGLLKKVAPQMRFVTANVVYDGDEFAHWIDEHGEHLKHVPSDKYDVPVARVYAMGQTMNGGVYIAVLPLAEVNKIRKSSRAQREDAPWNQWTSEMMKKTALRRLCKTLPITEPLPDDDDLPELEAPATAPPAIARAPGAAAALDQFAGSSPVATAPYAEEDGAQGIAEATAAHSGAAADSPAAADLVKVAHERGQRWRVANNSKKAIPPEYREPQAARLAAAWLAGFDNLELPLWKEETK